MMNARLSQTRRTDSLAARIARSSAYLLVLVTLALGGCAGPTVIIDLYVDPVAGDDLAPGTTAAPFRTLTHALGVAGAGQVIHLAAGTYDAANGEVWPTQTGSPPVATANVPDGVTITTDGADASLVGTGGAAVSALVFAGEATVNGVRISGFLRGVLAGQGTTVVLDGVEISGSSREGVLAYGNADLTLRSGHVHDNTGAGISAWEQAVVVVDGTLVSYNEPGVDARGEASLSVTGSDVFNNGTAISGSEHSGIRAMGNATLVVTDTVVRDNAYAGVHIEDAAQVEIGTAASIEGNYIGVIADAPMPSAASLAFNGATVKDNDYEGVYWGIPFGASFTMRDTAVVDNGDNGLFFAGDAFVIDLGTGDDVGGNDYTGNGEPLILDNRPARPAADGTIISVSYADTLAPCLIVDMPTVGPAAMSCGGVVVISITGVNNRVHVMP